MSKPAAIKPTRYASPLATCPNCPTCPAGSTVNPLGHHETNAPKPAGHHETNGERTN